MIASSEAFYAHVQAEPEDRQVSSSGALGYDEAEWLAWQAALSYVRPLMERMVAYNDTQTRSEPMKCIADDMRKCLEGMRP